LPPLFEDLTSFQRLISGFSLSNISNGIVWNNACTWKKKDLFYSGLAIIGICILETVELNFNINYVSLKWRTEK
jgi:hypothetical protein